jgi:hypothetical protein
MSDDLVPPVLGIHTGVPNYLNFTLTYKTESDKIMASDSF